MDIPMLSSGEQRQKKMKKYLKQQQKQQKQRNPLPQFMPKWKV